MNDTSNAESADTEQTQEEGTEPSLFPSGNEETAKLTAEVADLKDKYLRSLAEFENFKKRSQKERTDLIRYQGEPIIVDLLEVLDGFERALEHAKAEKSQLKEGLQMIHKQFVDTLGRWEIRGESAMDKEFDPNRHRAIGKQKVEGKPAGIVVGELKKPYVYRDKLIRFGEVIVSEGENDAEE